MKVLFVCHRVPFPPKRGGKIRPFNIIRHLHAQGHQVTVASLARTQEEADEAEGSRAALSKRLVEVVGNTAAWPRMVAWLPTTKPVELRVLLFPATQGTHRRGTGHGSRTTWSSSTARRSHRTSTDARAPVKIIDFGDMDSQKWREYSQHRAFPLSAGYWLEAVKLERTERLLAAKFDLPRARPAPRWNRCRRLGVKRPDGLVSERRRCGFLPADRAPTTNRT